MACRTAFRQSGELVPKKQIYAGSWGSKPCWMLWDMFQGNMSSEEPYSPYPPFRTERMFRCVWNSFLLRV